MVLNYDNHLEIHLVKNPPPPPEDKAFRTFVTISVSVTITITLELAGVIDIRDFLILDPIDPSQIVHPENDSSSNPEIPVVVTVPPNPEGTDSNHRVQIDQCHGVPSEGAYFRAYPAMAPDAIKGAVRRGEWVVLTGVKEYGDGITWYEVINESPLDHSPAAYAYEPAPNQYGWIASCFVE